MTEALVTPSVLRWARERREFTPATLAAKLPNVEPDQVASWELGAARPSLPQAEKVARVLRVPLGYLYLASPPDFGTPIPDLRTIDSEELGELSLNLRQFINDALVKQDWYREFLIDTDAEPLPYVGRYSETTSSETISKDIRAELRLTVDDLRGSNDEYKRLLVGRAEDIGTTVLRSGIVGFDTTRIIEVGECRGFALPDKFAPVVFVNSRDADTAQSFTLIHELAHIWLGKSGISNINPNRPRNGDRATLERLCNSVAAQVLMPKRLMAESWHAARHLGPREATESVARRLRVSRPAALIRATNLGYVSGEEFRKLYAYFGAQSKGQRSGSGGHTFHNLRARNGKHLTYALISSVVEGRMPANAASKMLGVSTSVVRKAAEVYDIL